MQLTNNPVAQASKIKLQEKLQTGKGKVQIRPTSSQKLKKPDSLEVEATFQSNPKNKLDSEFSQELEFLKAGKAFKLKNSSKGQSVEVTGPNKNLKLQNKGALPKGSLIMNDTFVGQPGEMTHGMVGSLAASQHGFKGNLVENHTDVQNPSELKLEASSNLLFETLSPQDARKALTNIVEEDAIDMYSQQSSLLEKLTAEGTQNSATNISRGSSKASATNALYSVASGAWEATSQDQFEQGMTALNNMASAFKLDTSKLLDSNPSVHGPARQQLQQSLANFSSDTIDNSKVIAQAKTRFQESVVNFEARNNSVIVAAGNEGQILDQLAAKNDGLSIETKPDFLKSILSIGEVTTVGATRFFLKDEKLTEKEAKYSSKHSGVNIHASGSVGITDPNKAQEYGTSFASPRVAAVMAELHRQNPDKSSGEIETLLKTMMTHEVKNGDKSIKVLDFGKSFELMQTGKL